MNKLILGRMHNERGMTLALTLLITIVLVLFGIIFILRTVNEKNLADRERHGSQAFYLAEGGTEAGLAQLDTLINTDMLNTVNTTNPQVLSNKAQSSVTNNDSLGFLIAYVKSGGTALLTQSGSQATYTGSSTSLGKGTYRFDIIITPKGNPVTVATDIWDFPYYYTVKATGTVKGSARKATYYGDFTVRVQRDNFAKYALFTDHHGMPSGSTVWFTSKTNFAGPIHTNEQYAFAFNPSGHFYNVVTQQNTKGKFYNNGSPTQINADSNGTLDVPTFDMGYTRGAAEIVLSSSVQKQDLIDQARGGDNTTGNGIFVANSSGALTGGIYVSGDATVQMGVDGSDNATYTITQGSTTKTVTVNRSANQTTVQTAGGGSVTYNGKPDGVDDLGTIIYVNGNITGFNGTTQKDTEVTVSSEFDIVVTDHLRYADYNAGFGTPGDVSYVPPNATDKTNLLGVVAWGGNIRVGSAAPNDIDMHGIMMARNGIFTVDSYNDQGVGSRGTATLLGGAITQFYGAFGLYSGSTGSLVAGYGRNFVYDSRTLVGKAPPYFPSMKTFIAFTDDITDKITFQEGN